VAGVLLYNHLQERSAKRAAERAFGGASRPDVFLEPTARALTEPAPVPVARQSPPPQGNAMPDSRVDYVMHLTLNGPVESAQLAQPLTALERRFARRAVLAASDGEGWRRIGGDEEAGRFTVLQAALQLVSRDGVVAESELLEFRAQVEALAAGIAASVSAPEMRQALEAAREMDRVCADADIQVALHVVGIAAVEAASSHPFQTVQRGDGVTLSLDVGRTPHPVRAFEAMARAAAELAAGGGRMIDDNGRPLDERALASIRAQVDAVCRALAERGIEPGSPLALRVFS
jgi:hypothetical protein